MNLQTIIVVATVLACGFAIPAAFALWDHRPRRRFEVVVYKRGVSTPIGVRFFRARRAIRYAQEATARARSLDHRALYGVERAR